MDGFIDIHTHILPSIDDGARDMEEALRMLQMAWDGGTRGVLLTPHYRGAYKRIPSSYLRETFEGLVQHTQKVIPGMKLYLGSELHHEQELADRLRDGSAMPIHNTRYVLLEFSTVSRRSQIVLGVENILYSGYIPIIAHVERYTACRDDKDLVDELLNMGALIQINAGSVLGEHGWGIRRYCHKLLRAQKVHFIASDAHREDWRKPDLAGCWKRVDRKYGREYAEKLFWENASKIINNKEVICQYDG